MAINFKGWRINPVFRGGKCWDMSDGCFQNWNNYKIYVKNNETWKSTSFDFWASIANPELETEYNILNAFRCFVDDAIAGEMDFPSFCADFGCSEDSIKALKIWKSCQRSSKKLRRIFDGDIYALLDSLEEYA